MIADKKRRIPSAYKNFQMAPVPIAIWRGQNLQLDFANESAIPLLKMQLQEALGKPAFEILNDFLTPLIAHDLYKHCLEHEQSQVLSERQIMYFENERLNIRWYDVQISPYYDEGGKADGVIMFFKDISERIIEGKSIELREQYLTKLFKQAPVGIVCYRGPEFIVDLANDQALAMWGKTMEDVKGRPIVEIFPEVESDPVINQRHRESLEKLKRGETHIVNEVELTFVRNGRPHVGWYNYIHEPYANTQGEIIGMMAIAIEVTDQVKARQKLQLITDALPALVSYINANEQYEFVNQTYESWFGVSRAQIVNKSILEVLGATAYEKVKPHVYKALSGQVDSFTGWIPYRNEKRYITASYIPHIDADNRVLGYFGLVNDLTALKISEQALSEKEERLNLLISAVNAGTFDYTIPKGNIHWSDELKSLLGISIEQEITSDLAWGIVHPDDHHLVASANEHLMTRTTDVVTTDYRIKRHDSGEIRWMHSRYKVVSSPADRTKFGVRVIGFTIDITDRKIAEEQLRAFNVKLEEEVRERTEDLLKINELLREKNEQLTRAHSFLQQLIDSSVEIIGVVDTDLKYIAVNSTFEKRLNQRAADVLGRTITEVFPAAINSEQIDHVKKALEGQAIRSKASQALVDPKLFVESHFVPLRQKGAVVGVIIMVRDVTEIVKNERQLENLNRQLEDAQQLARLGSWEWDVSSGTIIWSDEMYRIYGYDEKFPVDFVRATERMSTEHAERSSRRTQRFIQEATEKFKITRELLYEIPPIEFPITLPNGSRKTLRSSGRIQLREDGKLYRVLGAIQDVTEIRQVEDKLHSLVEQLEQKNTELESFNYIASHDLQEPLRKIQTFADRMLSATLTSEQQKDHLLRINNSAKRMGNLIASMLMLSRISNSEDNFIQVDLNKVLEMCKSDLEVRIRETNSLIINDHLPTIKGNEFQLNQLFTNLLGNSIKFCDTVPLIKIECSRVTKTALPGAAVETDQEFWCLRFIDNGIGFDQQFKEQIFEPFQRLHAKSEYEGTGIGLSIVKKIVKRHHGHIDVISEKGKGSEFLVWLPVT